MCFVLDEDDEANYPRIEGAEYLIAPASGRRGMCDPTNYAARILAERCDAIFWMGDDHRFGSANWLEEFQKALDAMGGSGFVYGDDGIVGEEVPTACLVTTDIIRALGHLCWPELQHLFIDNYWKELGTAIGRIAYLPHVKIPHEHWTVGKAPDDLTYQEAANRGVFEADQRVFERWKAEYKDEEVRKILRALGD